jgi:hypothetical protein
MSELAVPDEKYWVAVGSLTELALTDAVPEVHYAGPISIAWSRSAEWPSPDYSIVHLKELSTRILGFTATTLLLNCNTALPDSPGQAWMGKQLEFNPRKRSLKVRVAELPAELPDVKELRAIAKKRRKAERLGLWRPSAADYATLLVELGRGAGFDVDDLE